MRKVKKPRTLLLSAAWWPAGQLGRHVTRRAWADFEKAPDEMAAYERLLAFQWLTPDITQLGGHPRRNIIERLIARVEEGAQLAVFLDGPDCGGDTATLVHRLTGHGPIHSPRNRPVPPLLVDPDVDPELAAYIRSTAGRYWLTGMQDIEAAEVVLASHGEPESIVAITARRGAGAWAVLPIAATEAGKAVDAAEILFERYDSPRPAPPRRDREIGLDGNGRTLNIKLPRFLVPMKLGSGKGDDYRPVTLRNGAGRLLLAIAARKPLPARSSKDTTHLRNALAETTEDEVKLEGRGDGLRLEPHCPLSDDLADR